MIIVPPLITARPGRCIGLANFAMATSNLHDFCLRVGLPAAPLRRTVLMTGFYSNLLLLWFVVLSIVMVVLLFSAHVVIRRIRKKERKYKDVYLAARRLQGDRKINRQS